MIKSQPYAVLIQRAFRHVHVSSSTEITMEFSFVGIKGRRQRVIGSNRAVGGSSRETATAFPNTTQICDISSDRPSMYRSRSSADLEFRLQHHPFMCMKRHQTASNLFHQVDLDRESHQLNTISDSSKTDLAEECDTDNPGLPIAIRNLSQ
jgi:hypothetical protein